MLVINDNKYQGSLLGLAIGDALGAPIEFYKPGTFQPISFFVGGGMFKLNPGEFTDDTSMALCLAESLIRCEGFDAKDQMECSRCVPYMFQTCSRYVPYMFHICSG